ncbi:MAG: type I restriction endonuclease subunit M [Beijerinckiaceae bacterium]|nr:MAG: type I restriction endonuclease subunit M [Beijerinckiaceae bacterium]
MLVTLLGYTPYRAGETFTVATEEALGKGAVDTALGAFSGSERTILAPFELKGPGTEDLDAIMPGRSKSPVQQAWEYAIDAPGAKWVLVSNCAEIRLYAFGHGRELYETWDLERLDDPQEHERLWLFIGAQNLLSGRTAALLDESANEQKDITNKLYILYKETRDKLIQILEDQPPRLTRLAAIEHTQTILDRVIFIKFAELTSLLPPKLIHKAWDEKSPFRQNSAWENFVGLFEAVDKGKPELDIPAYNGGLFAKNAIIDALGLPYYVCENFDKIAEYDFSSEEPVSVLGHIFEQSVSDIEAMRAQAQGQEPPKTTKRKRDGVVYTPPFVTRFIVEETIGKTLSERFAAVRDAHGVVEIKSEKGVTYDWMPEVERAVWLDYRQELRGLTIVDPACGSGAFLIAAFDYLAAEYKRVAERLAALGEAVDASEGDREILAGNLHGVDLNPEPVEITKLSLWLKTAKRGKLLQDLEQSVKCGNSLIADKNERGRAFDWQAEFPEIFARGGFDIVLGNPPYVRMETIKPFKPYLEKHYAVAADRADIYAYFYERGFELLRPGGRLGYISSSTFLRTGSGENLRRYLRTRAEIETVVDFGDLQIFEGVTTYPAIVTMRRAPTANEVGQEGELRFLNIKSDVPEDLHRAFRAEAKAMPRARLGDGSWQLEGDTLAALRAKIRAGKKTLGEVYGPPLYGIKTGLNEAFIVSRERRDELVARDMRSAELLVSFLRGENIKRWRIESEDLFLIDIPRGKVRIEDYPPIRDHLLPFKPALEARATKQEWFELQQAQLAYQPIFSNGGIGFPDISQSSKFSRLPRNTQLDCTCFVAPFGDYSELAYLNSKLVWFQLFDISNPLRGGTWRLRLKAQYVEQIIVPAFTKVERSNLFDNGQSASTCAKERFESIESVLRRIPDLCPPGRAPKLTNRLREWWKLDFKSFRAEIKKAFKDDIPLKQRNDWESLLREEGEKVRRLTTEIEQAEREIDAIVYKLFDLTPAEITLLESSLAGQY